MHWEELRARLERNLLPIRLEIVDFSDQHAGHLPEEHQAPAGEVGTHIELKICSPLFSNKNRVQRERLVHAALGPALGGRIHALVLKLTAPEEEGGQ